MSSGIRHHISSTAEMCIIIQRAMRAAFPQAEPSVTRFYGMQEYHLGWRDTTLQPSSADPGKLIRPQLALLACSVVGGDASQALPLAASIQLAHDFTLLHDDIQDNSDLRRGRVTVWKEWGIGQGVNAGDGLLLVAHLALYQLADAGVPPAVVLEVARRFNQTILDVCEGQFLDMSFEGRLDLGEDDYLAMIGRKTAALLAGATSLGAIVGGAEPAAVQALANFGRNLGLSFQIQDDVLGIWGQPAITGKPYAADLLQRKVSLPIIRALHEDAAAAVLCQVYSKPALDEQDVQVVLDALAKTSVRRSCEELSAHYHQQAIAALECLGTPTGHNALAALEQLHTITAGLLGRQK